MIRILGVKIDNLNENEILERIEGFLKNNRPRIGRGKQHYLVTPNPEFLVQAQKDKEFKEILNQADISIPDGVGLILSSHFLGQPIRKRIAGVDLMELICQKAAEKNWSVFLTGGEKGIAEKATENLIKKYPELKINSQNPKIVFVALGAPKQEKWIKNNLNKMPSVKLAMGVGGAFDFISNNTKRAPKALREIGLEWLWRLALEPWRMKRIYRAVVVFPYLVLKKRLRSIIIFF